MRRYRLTKKADADLTGLYRYGVQTFGQSRADHHFDGLVEKLQSISDNPMMYQKSDYRDGYRRAVYPPYTIYYRIVDAAEVEIVRILYGQDPREVR